MAIFLFIACLFIPLGGACLAASLSVVETRYRYDDYCMRNFLQSNQTIPLGQLTFTTKQAEDALNMVCHPLMSAPPLSKYIIIIKSLFDPRRTLYLTTISIVFIHLCFLCSSPHSPACPTTRPLVARSTSLSRRR